MPMSWISFRPLGFVGVSVVYYCDPSKVPAMDPESAREMEQARARKDRARRKLQPELEAVAGGRPNNGLVVHMVYLA